MITITKIKLYFWNILIALDQLINTILGGDPDETISSRMGKIVAKKPDSCVLCVWICNVLHWFDADHCNRVAEADRGDRNVIK